MILSRLLFNVQIQYSNREHIGGLYFCSLHHFLRSIGCRIWHGMEWLHDKSIIDCLGFGDQGRLCVPFCSYPWWPWYDGNCYVCAFLVFWRMIAVTVLFSSAPHKVWKERREERLSDWNKTFKDWSLCCLPQWSFTFLCSLCYYIVLLIVVNTRHLLVDSTWI